MSTKILFSWNHLIYTFCNIRHSHARSGSVIGRCVCLLCKSRAYSFPIDFHIEVTSFWIVNNQIHREVIESVSTRGHCERSSRAVVSRIIIIIIYLLSVCYMLVSITIIFINLYKIRETEVSKLITVVHNVASTSRKLQTNVQTQVKKINQFLYKITVNNYTAHIDNN